MKCNQSDPGFELFIICLDYVLRTYIDIIKDNGFKLAKERSRRYPEKTITDADYANDIAVLANTPAQAETLLHSLERAAAGKGIYAKAHKTEYKWFNQIGNISKLNGSSLRLEDKFTYFGSSISSTKTDINTRLAKSWTANDRCWSDLTGKIKCSFFQAANTIKVRRNRHAGYCRRSNIERRSDILLWTPSHGRAKAWRPARTYIQQLCADTGYSLEDILGAMDDRDWCQERVRRSVLAVQHDKDDDDDDDV